MNTCMLIYCYDGDQLICLKTEYLAFYFACGRIYPIKPVLPSVRQQSFYDVNDLWCVDSHR